MNQNNSMGHSLGTSRISTRKTKQLPSQMEKGCYQLKPPIAWWDKFNPLFDPRLARCNFEQENKHEEKKSNKVQVRSTWTRVRIPLSPTSTLNVWTENICLSSLRSVVCTNKLIILNYNINCFLYKGHLWILPRAGNNIRSVITTVYIEISHMEEGFTVLRK